MEMQKRFLKIKLAIIKIIIIESTTYLLLILRYKKLKSHVFNPESLSQFRHYTLLICQCSQIRTRFSLTCHLLLLSWHQFVTLVA